MNVQSFCDNVIHVHGCLTRTRIRCGGMQTFHSCGCMGKVCCSESSSVSMAKAVVFTSGSGQVRPSVRACFVRHGDADPCFSASVIEDVMITLRNGEVLAYFYCDFRNERSTSGVEVLRSLLSQLLHQFRRHMVDPGDLIDELIEERDEGASTISNVMVLARHVSRVAKQFPQRPSLVIDALDECKDVEVLLDALVELHKDGIRLFVISRPLQIIKDSFLSLPSIDMETMHYQVLADIKLHVTKELDSHRRLRIVDARLKDEIHSTLCKRAGGM